MSIDRTKCDVLVAGGGISGLSATLRLNQAGIDTVLLEARDRFGGRVLTTDTSAAACDLGPSWFWPGQPLIAKYLQEMGIAHYHQFDEGAVLHQQPDGRSVEVPGPSPMTGALRIDSGIGALADAIATRIEPAHLRRQHVVDAVTLADDRINVHCQTPDGLTTFNAQHVAIAMPLRLVANVQFSPALPDATVNQLRSTPTWMAGHAKFFAVYDQPFWRKVGLCGSAVSRCGPLAEIHDASPNNDSKYCLFGFVGLDANARLQLGKERLMELAVEQLATLFGADAMHPVETHYHDWSQQPFTADKLDQTPQTRHPTYGIRPDCGPDWSNRLHFIVSETSRVNGGLIEGAFESAHRLVSQLITSGDPATDEAAPHKASMGWDWLPKATED